VCPFLPYSSLLRGHKLTYDPTSRSFVFRQRNFDRGTRQPIKAVQSKPAVVADVETVEKRVAGLAERIIAEDAVKRMEDLVSMPFENCRRTCSRLYIFWDHLLTTDPGHASQDLLNIAPKRANWDLRRDMDKRMKKLERKTQEAYATLFRKPSPPVRISPYPNTRLFSLFSLPGQRLIANKTNGASAGTIPSGQDLVASMEAADRERRRGELSVPDAGSGDESDD
jgi:hypothetical protein